jgi:hypothetical protein
LFSNAVLQIFSILNFTFSNSKVSSSVKLILLLIFSNNAKRATPVTLKTQNGILILPFDL